MKLANASFNQFNENECLNNGVSCSPDGEAAMVSFVENPESVAKVVFNSALGSYTNLIFGGRVLITYLAAFAGLLSFLFFGWISRVILAGFWATSVLGSLCILRDHGRLVRLLVRLFCVRGLNSVAHLEFEYPHKLLKLKNYKIECS